MKPRLQGLAHIWRQQPYEAAIALAAGSELWALHAHSQAGAASRVLPPWALYAADALFATGGLMTLAALIAIGYTADDVRRVLARRLEQGGQLLIASVLAATAIGAFSAGSIGVVPGAVYCALGAAAATRAALIARTFSAHGHDRTDLE